MPNSYNYNYNYQNHNKGRNSDWSSWILTILALLFLPPLGLILLFRKLMGYSGSGARWGKPRARHPYDLRREAVWQQQQQQQGGAYAPPGSQGAPGAAQQQQQQSAPPPGPQQRPAANAAAGGPVFHQYAPQAKGWTAKRQEKAAWKAANLSAAPKGKGLIIAGSILMGIFGLAALVVVAEFLSYGWWSGDELVTFLLSFALTGVGGVMTAAGILRGKNEKRYRKYLSYIGRRQNLSIHSLAQTMGVSFKTVCNDLQDMLDLGILPTGYIDYQSGRLILSEEGITDEAPPPAEKKEAQKKATTDDEILMEIRQINDLIDDPDVSMKIDRIGEITGKILAYQRNNPNKAGQLRQFLSYYLPTTLKILRAYAQLEAQGVEGENITGAKERIEGMMDKVVEGFEKQLDRLFQNDAMDITTDVAVLERMIESDGLSGGGTTLPL